ncbi:MAG: ATP-binding protein [Candidatus Brocadiales bacterium]|nr:ATP-binding protein [Candidatus Brocadiales bacterium]
MADIINIQNYTDALRNTGYKNVESAIAEIVDNSLEADAKDVLIICSLDFSTGRKVVSEMAILDNGIGMDKDTLEKCLVIGESTRRKRKGMGRFGVGLPQASLHVCPRVEVYSWQDKDQIRSVYLDIDAVKSGSQKEIEGSNEEQIPNSYKKYFENYEHLGKKIDFNKTGTLVVWKKCDRLKPKTVSSLFERFKFLLGRKFRYFIHQSNHYIGLTVNGTTQQDEFLRPNDPLCLMDDNMVLGDINDPKHIKEKGESIFEFWENGDVCGTVNIPIKYSDLASDTIKESNVEIKFSWAKPEFHIAGGECQIGKFIKRNVGVSIIRAKREIDFNKFDFFSDVNEPQHRWWGCEIRFTPELDEAFGVANNKQHVELFELAEEEYAEEELKPIWFSLNKIVGNEIREIFKKLKSRRKDSRKKKPGHKLPEEALVEAVEAKNLTITASHHNKECTSQEELFRLGKMRLIDSGNPDPSQEDVEKALEPPVKLDFRDLGDSSAFIDISSKMGNCWLTINTGSVFYRDLYSKIEEEDDSVKRAFNLILMAFARAEDEAFNNHVLYESFREVREQWGIKLRKYLKTDFMA